MIRSRKFLLLSAVGIFIAPTLCSQSHINSWFRTTVSYPVNKKITGDIELQHRRQNGYDNTNLFDQRLMFTFRTWIHYHHNKDIRFSISPFAWFEHYNIIQSPTDEFKRPMNELRLTTAMDLQHELFKNFHITDRNALEYRHFNNDQSGIIRLRNRLGVRHRFSEYISIGIYDELLFNITGVSKDHFFDHDRRGLTIEYTLSPALKIDMGYLHIRRLPLNHTEPLNENNMMMNITYKMTAKKSIRTKYPDL